jgi:hypothetical protein
MEPNPMDNETFSFIVWGAVLVGTVVSIYFARRHRRGQAQRQLIMELFKEYFLGDIAVDQLRQRTLEMTNYYFIQTEFQSLAVAAFQHAVDAARQSQSKEDDRKLLGLLAALKTKFGLTDFHQIEAWNAGRQ